MLSCIGFNLKIMSFIYLVKALLCYIPQLFDDLEFEIEIFVVCHEKIVMIHIDSL